MTLSFRSLKPLVRAWLVEPVRLVIASGLVAWVVAQSKPRPLSHRSALVIAPHQDDETLGCGGLIALKREQGIPVRVVFVTDGAGGRPAEIAPEAIVQIRQQEAIAALAILGVDSSHVDFLAEPDGSLSTLAPAQRQSLINQLATLIKTHQPGELYVPHRFDNHPDHEATFELVQAAIQQADWQGEMLQYPIWLFWKSPKTLLRGHQTGLSVHRLPLNGTQAQKKQAIAQYASQQVGLPKGFLSRFYADYELFFSRRPQS
jgi:N-acetylglucosamine malate deacetylase 1